MDSQKQQAADRIKQASNVLVTVSSNPSVDQLAACIGLTLAINKLGKHATAVFSGEVPSTLEFLQPEKTIEKNTDSLRDFIIALDKSKADKLRYKVEDKLVKIFITPYRTSIDEKDLEFSQGDFNVDVVVALGVHSQAELDRVITAHGRILHDATVITINTRPGGELGGINWLELTASSLSELAAELIDLVLDKKQVDKQIATALLTGIVAETDRFSNGRTSPRTMSLSAELMAAGADQQLVATKLEKPAPLPPVAEVPKTPVADQPPKPAADGTLEIEHEGKERGIGAFPPTTLPAQRNAYPYDEGQQPLAPQINIDEHGALSTLDDNMLPPPTGMPDVAAPAAVHHDEPPKIMLQPPTMGGQFGADGTPAGDYTEQDSNPPDVQNGESVPTNTDEEGPSGGSTSTDSFIVGGAAPVSSPEPTVNSSFPSPEETLSQIERDVHSKHLSDNMAPAPTDSGVGSSLPPQPVAAAPTPAPALSDQPQVAVDPALQMPDVNQARDAVEQAIDTSSDSSLEPLESLNAQTADLALGGTDNNAAQPGVDESSQQEPSSQTDNPPGSPPPGPPPMMPPVGLM
jgi:nanoRNase/pAp phosphatase (c-di-AMP/oligoRNAs hydrolase)